MIDQGLDIANLFGSDGKEPVEQVGPKAREHILAARAAVLDLTEEGIRLALIADGASEPGAAEDAIASAVDATNSIDEVGRELREGRELPYFGNYPY